jgi:hypothetical protein
LTKDPQRPTKYRDWLAYVLNDIIFQNLGIQFPFDVTEENVKKLEDYFNVTINTYTFDSDLDDKLSQIQRLYLSQSFDNKNIDKIHVDALMIENEDKTINHFVVIKNLSGFFSGKIHFRNEHLNICPKCITHTFKTKEDLENHKNECYQLSDDTLLQKFEMPNEANNILKYKSGGAELFHPYVTYLDFEATLKKIETQKKNTTLINEHKANSFGMYNNYYKNYINQIGEGDTLVDQLNETLFWSAKAYNKLRKTNKKPIKDQKSIENFEETDNCEICHVSFSSENGIRNGMLGS